MTLATPGGGRARTNQWIVHEPRASNARPAMAPRTRVTPNEARPLLATVRGPACDDLAMDPPQTDAALVKGPGLSDVSGLNPAQDRTVSGRKGPESSGVSGLNPAQDRTVSRKTPPETPPETPPANARTGREPRNPQTSPPSPPGGGSDAGLVEIVENYTSARGRRRQRTVLVDPDETRQQRRPGDADQVDWQRIRDELRGAVGESLFAIWLEPLKLRAIDEGAHCSSQGPIRRDAGPVAGSAGCLTASVMRSAARRALPMTASCSCWTRSRRRRPSPGAHRSFPLRDLTTTRRPYDHHHIHASRPR